ncbi:MAG: glycosyltransferase family 2 protein [candidate division WOR-3 bacterium]|nr:glycosyltransferase family 2 protein [candidate division WOR-3 bacterium]
MKDISLIIVNYNTTKYLINLINFLKEKDYQIVVVDNNSEEELPIEYFKNNNILLIKLKKNYGYAKAINIGLKYVSGEYIGILNPDIILNNNEIEELVAYLEKNQNWGCIAPLFINEQKEILPSARSFPKLSYLFFGYRSIIYRLFKNNPYSFQFLNLAKYQREEPIEVDSVIGTFIIFRKKALEDIGNFDEKFFLFAEDLDICKRLWEKNWKVILYPKVKIIHYLGKARSKNFVKSEKERLRSFYYFFKKHYQSFFLIEWLFSFALLLLYFQINFLNDTKIKLF